MPTLARSVSDAAPLRGQETWADCWLSLGLTGHITNLCLRKLYGNSPYAYTILQEIRYVSSSDLPTSSPLFCEAPAHPVEHTAEHKARKAALVIRLIEKRIGEANFWKVRSGLCVFGLSGTWLPGVA